MLVLGIGSTIMATIWDAKHLLHRKVKKRKKEKRNVVTKFIESSLLQIITMIIALKKPSYFSIKHFPLNEKEHIHVMVTLCTSSQQLTSQTLYPTLFSYVSSPFSPPADCHAHQSMSSQVHCIGSNSGSISAMFFFAWRIAAYMEFSYWVTVSPSVFTINLLPRYN